MPHPLVVYRASTAEVGGVFPFVGGQPLPPTGASVGVDTRSGAGFCVDPAGWVLAEIVSNPNLVLFGKPGTGKSTTVKAILFRLMLFGVRTLVAGDVKDEYEKLARAVGVEPFALGVGMPTRINPLDLGPLGAGWDSLGEAERAERARVIFGRWLVLLKALIGAQGVVTTPADEDALSAVLAQLTGWAAGSGRLRVITIPAVWAALRDPSPDLAHACRYPSPAAMVEATRQVTAALGAMVRGALAGLFDQPTNIVVDWSAPIQSLSLGRLLPLGDQAIGTALACLNSWSRAMTDTRRHTSSPGNTRVGGPQAHTVVVRDEVWRQMRLGVGAVQSLDADLRLSRAEACTQLVVAHKPSDMLAVGDTGSQAANIAKDLLNLCDTKVLLGQDRNVAAQLQTLLGLSDMETDDIAGWARQRRGRAIWRVGERSYRVQTIRGPAEAELFDTNEAFRNLA
ncbi:MAG TPA: ATP-binding protein [Dermatophilaceae bacterium]|nr:ATP-binding protein [Dermatophilaceae bacterium]